MNDSQSIVEILIRFGLLDAQNALVYCRELAPIAALLSCTSVQPPPTNNSHYDGAEA
jgi:hypothetical protein